MALKTKDIIKPNYLTIAQTEAIPALINEWLTVDDDQTLDDIIRQQTVSYATYYTNGKCRNIKVIKIEKLEWSRDCKGRHNDYQSDITIWVTAIVELGDDKIVRLSFDLFDSMIATTETGCNGVVY